MMGELVFDIFVGKAQSPQGLLGHFVDNVVELCLYCGRYWLLFIGELIVPGCTRFKDNLAGSFDKENVSVVEPGDNRHSFSLRIERELI